MSQPQKGGDDDSDDDDDDINKIIEEFVSNKKPKYRICL
jgi:hypothetical protein